MSDSDRLLIVDDEPDVRAFFRDVAEELGYVAAEAGDQTSFAAELDRHQPTVIMLDLTLPNTDGIVLLRDLAGRSCRAPVILTSGQDSRVLTTAQRLGRGLGLNMQSVLRKPVSVSNLEAALNEARAAAGGTTREALEQAIWGGELILHFQPKVDLQCGDSFPVIGCEALVRWRHPMRGLVPPGQFVPLAEQTGLIGPLTDVVLQQTIAQLKQWRAEGIELPVSVNLSPKQLTDLTLPDRMASMLSEAGIDPHLLVAEITEQAAMADIGKATDILTRLRLKNISVSLDDFGVGYSSLVRLYQLPISELKFDRSLIVDVDHDADARTFVKALMAFAKGLNFPVCVEGIETQKTALFMQSLGCETAQGFYFAKPLTPEMFLDLVKRRYSAALERDPEPDAAPPPPPAARRREVSASQARPRP